MWLPFSGFERFCRPLHRRGRRRASESPFIRDRPSEDDTAKRWRELCKLARWIAANAGLTWEPITGLSPRRLRFVSRAIDRRRVFDKLAIFETRAALMDEKSLNRLNRELREVQE